MNALSAATVRLISSSQVISTITSVVKELVENSLDAGATNIEVKLENSGLEKVEVTDNGTGIKPEDAEHMAQRHYTSKISDEKDLLTLSTFGFRGEALASLCAVADVSISSKRDTDLVGTCYCLDHEGKIKNKMPSAIARGTVIIASKLFARIPVRKQMYGSKKKQKEELKNVENVLMSFGLVFPNVRVTFRHNREMMWQKGVLPDFQSSLVLLVGRDTVRKMVHIHEKDESLEIEAFLPKPSDNLNTVTRATSDKFFTFVNKRPVQLKDFVKVLKSHLFNKKVALVRYPVGFLSIITSPSNLDVNLEPNKSKVLFRDDKSILAAFTHCIEKVYGPLNAQVYSREYNEKIVNPCYNGKKEISHTKHATDELEGKELLKEVSHDLNGNAFSLSLMTDFENQHLLNRSTTSKDSMISTDTMQEISTNVSINKPLAPADHFHVTNISDYDQNPISSSCITNSSGQETSILRSVDRSVVGDGNVLPIGESFTSGYSFSAAVNNNNLLVQPHSLGDRDAVVEISSPQEILKTTHTSLPFFGSTSEQGARNSHQETTSTLSESTLIQATQPDFALYDDHTLNDLTLHSDSDDAINSEKEEHKNMMKQSECVEVNYPCSTPCISDALAYDCTKFPKDCAVESGDRGFFNKETESRITDSVLFETLGKESRKTVVPTQESRQQCVKGSANVSENRQGCVSDFDICKSNACLSNPPETDLCEANAEAWSRGQLLSSQDDKVLVPVTLLQPPVSAQSSICKRSRDSPTSTTCKKRKLTETRASLFETSTCQRVKRPQSAYIFFCKKMRPAVARENPQANFTEISRMVGERWNMLALDEKKKYEALSREDLQRYKEHIKQKKSDQQLSLTSAASEKKRIGCKAQAKTSVIELLRAAAKNQSSACSSFRKVVPIEYSLKVASKILRGSVHNSQLSGRTSKSVNMIGSLPERGLWMCEQGASIMVFQPFRAREWILFRRLMDSYVLASHPISPALELDVSSVGGEDCWNVLLKLSREESCQMSYREITDLRLVSNGFQVSISQTECITRIMLNEMSTCIPYYGIPNLQEVLQKITLNRACSVADSRPSAVMHYLRGESVRMAQTLSVKLPVQDVQEIIGSILELTPADSVVSCKCVHGKPCFITVHELV